jgi:polyisoprenoid-binding protein YceI
MATTKWAVDALHSELGFKIRHLMIANVSGIFQKFNIEVVTAGHDFSTARIEAKVDMSSINTHNEQRDEHLRNSHFFETEKYPELIFRSVKIEKVDDETFNLYGDLTMKGITKTVKLQVEHSSVTKDPWGGERAGFVVTGKINRSDWGISFNNVMETGGLALGEEVKINAEIQLVKQAAELAA